MRKRKDGFWWHLIVNLAGLGLAALMTAATDSIGGKFISCLFMAVMVLVTVSDWQKFSKTEEELKWESDFMANHKAFMEEQRSRAKEQLSEARNGEKKLAEQEEKRNLEESENTKDDQE